MRDEFTIMRQGKRFVLFAGLLDEAQSRGLVGIDTELIQTPDDSNGNVAIVKALVEIDDGANRKSFSGVGDASPDNVSRNIVPHLIRMAETRAKARALRDAVNISAEALEDLADEDNATDSTKNTGAATNHRSESIQHSRTSSNTEHESTASEGQNGDKNAGKGGNRGQDGNHGQGGQRATQNAGTDNVRSISTGQDKNDKEAHPGSHAGSNDSGRPEDGDAAQERRARKSTIDFIKVLAEEWRGENAVERLESRIGKNLSELSESEAQTWIDRLTPNDQTDKAASGEE